MSTVKSVVVFVLVFGIYVTGNDDEHNQQNLNKFIRHIFNKYGSGGVMTFEGFEHLLHNIGLGNIEFSANHRLEEHRPIDYTFKSWNEVSDDYGQPMREEDVWHEIIFKQLHENHHHETRHSLLSRAGRDLFC